MTRSRLEPRNTRSVRVSKQAPLGLGAFHQGTINMRPARFVAHDHSFRCHDLHQLQDCRVAGFSSFAHLLVHFTTVLGPCSQSTCRIASSTSEGRGVSEFFIRCLPRSDATTNNIVDIIRTRSSFQLASTAELIHALQAVHGPLILP